MSQKSQIVIIRRPVQSAAESTVIQPPLNLLVPHPNDIARLGAEGPVIIW
jgi:hypothetical protein